MNRFSEFITAKPHEYIIYRLWAAIVGFFLPLYGFALLYFIPESIERIDHRFIISSLYASIIISSFFSQVIRTYMPAIVTIIDAITISWIAWIVHVNNFMPEYSVGLLITFCCFVIFKRNKVEMLFFGAYFSVILGLLCYFTPNALINKNIYILSMFIIILVYTLYLLRMNYVNNKLNSLNYDLEQKNKELERFVYVASHDLKSPLRRIGSFASLMKRQIDTSKNKELEEYMQYILTGTKKMNDTIDDLLKYSKFGYQELNFSYTSPVTAIEEALSAILLDKDAVDVQYNPKLLPKEIIANGQQLFQLFQNLIENAIKYNLSEEKIIKIEYRASKKHHYFSVTDNGIGIDPKYSEKIFELFQRLHLSHQFEGTGIGLSICKRIVERHSGLIKLLDEQDQEGSTFEFSILKNLPITKG